jgi:hypothetical protein
LRVKTVQIAGMKKLEDIPKQNIFTTPEDYFDKLPGMIQARVQKAPEAKPYLSYAFKYALPAIAFLLLFVFWFNQPALPTDSESLLSNIQTEDLMAYINESDISTEDLLDNVDLYTDDLDEIENEVYDLTIGDETLNAIDSDIDLDTL